MGAGELEQTGSGGPVDLDDVEGPGEPPDRLLVLTLEGPIPTEGRRQPGAEDPVATGPAPLEGRPQVGHLEAKAGQGHLLLRPAEPGVGVRRVAGHPSGHPIERGVAIGVFGLERRGPVGPQRVEHPVGVVAVGHDERTVDHGGQQVERIGVEAVTRDGGGRREGEPPGEDAQTAEERLLVLVEEIDAPHDGGSE